MSIIGGLVMLMDAVAVDLLHYLRILAIVNTHSGSW